MNISADPNNAEDYRRNFWDAEITLNGDSVDCFEANKTEGWVKCFVRNSDNSIQFSDGLGKKPSFEKKYGVVSVDVAILGRETPCFRRKKAMLAWWQKPS